MSILSTIFVDKAKTENRVTLEKPKNRLHLNRFVIILSKSYSYYFLSESHG